MVCISRVFSGTLGLELMADWGWALELLASSTFPHCPPYNEVAALCYPCLVHTLGLRYIFCGTMLNHRLFEALLLQFWPRTAPHFFRNHLTSFFPPTGHHPSSNQYCSLHA